MMNKFMEIYSKLFKNNKNSFIDIMINIINKLERAKDSNFKRNQKYTTKDYICGIIEVVSNNTSWRKYNGLINGRVLNNKHNYYCKIGVYDELYKTNLDMYKKSNKKEQKYLSMDSTFIMNKYGKEKIGRNVYYKNKQGRKISVIVDTRGIPEYIKLSKGNEHDAKIAPKIINKMSINKDNDRYLLADKGYDSKKIRELIRKKNYKPIIAKRKYRNKKRSLTKTEVEKYRKRIIVENFFS